MLTNGTSVEGTFGGSWKGDIEVVKGILQDKEKGEALTDGQGVFFSNLQYVINN